MSYSVVLFRDTFDPLTRSQLVFARAALLRLGADVIFSPTYKGECPINIRANLLNQMVKKENVPEFKVDLFEAKGKGQYGIFESIRHINLLYPKAKIYVPLSGEGMIELGAERLKKLSAIASILFVYVPGEKVDDHLLEIANAVRFPHGAVGDYQSKLNRDLKQSDLPPYVREAIESNDLYYLARMKNYVSPRRLIHCVSVANLAYVIALRAKIENPEAAYIAGIVHDIAKNVSEATSRRILAKYRPEVLDFPTWTFHQFVGPILAKEEFGIDDPSIAEAISCHATGKAHMIPLAKILYSADKIEPTRGFDSTDLIQACLKNYYVGFLTVLDANREYLTSKGYLVDNPLTKECFELYLGEKQ